MYSPVERLARSSVVALSNKSEEHFRCWTDVIQPRVNGIIDSLNKWETAQRRNAFGGAVIESADRVTVDQLYQSNALEFMHKVGIATNMANPVCPEDMLYYSGSVTSPASVTSEEAMLRYPIPRTVLDIGAGAFSRAIAALCCNRINQYIAYIPHTYEKPHRRLETILAEVSLIADQSYGNIDAVIVQEMVACLRLALSSSLHLLHMNASEKATYLPDDSATRSSSSSVWTSIKTFVIHRIKQSNGLLSIPQMLLINNVGDAALHVRTLRQLFRDPEHPLESENWPSDIRQAIEKVQVDNVVNCQWIQQTENDLVLLQSLKLPVRNIFETHERSLAYVGQLLNLNIGDICAETSCLFDACITNVVLCWPPLPSKKTPEIVAPGAKFKEIRTSAFLEDESGSLHPQHGQKITNTLIGVVPHQHYSAFLSEQAGPVPGVFSVPAYIYASRPSNDDVDTVRNRWAHRRKANIPWLVTALTKTKKVRGSRVKQIQSEPLCPPYTTDDYLAIHYRTALEQRVFQPSYNTISGNASILSCSVWEQVETYLRKWTRGAHDRFAIWINSGMEQATAYFAAMSSNATFSNKPKHHLMSHIAMLPSYQNLVELEMHKANMHLLSGWLLGYASEDRDVPPCLPVHGVLSVHNDSIDAFVRVLVEISANKPIASETPEMLQTYMEKTIGDALAYRQKGNYRLIDPMEDLRLIVINNDFPRYQALIAHMALRALQKRMDRFAAENLTDTSDENFKQHKQKLEQSEMWVCFTHDFLDEQSDRVRIGETTWFRHHRIALTAESYVYNTNGKATKAVALYRKIAPSTTTASLTESLSSLSLSEIPLSPVNDRALLEYVQRNEAAERVYKKEAMIILDSESLSTQDSMALPDLPTALENEIIDLGSESQAFDSDPMSLEAVAEERLSATPSEFRSQVDSTFLVLPSSESKSGSAPVFSRMITDDQEQQECQEIAEEIVDVLIPEIDDAYMDLLDARMTAMNQDLNERDIVEQLRQIRLEQSAQDRAAVSNFVKNVPREFGHQQDVLLYPFKARTKIELDELLRYPDDFLISPSDSALLRTDSPQTPTLVQATNWISPERTQVEVVHVAQRDELTLYVDTVLGNCAFRMAVLGACALNVDRSSEEEILDTTLVRQWVQEQQLIYIKSREAWKELEKLRIGKITRDWLQTIIITTNKALITDNYDVRKKLLSLFQRLNASDALLIHRAQKTVSEALQHASSMAVYCHEQIIDAAQDNEKIITALPYRMYSRLLGEHLNIRGFLDQTSDAIDFGLRRLATAYALRRLCIVHYANKYYDQIQAEQTASDLLDQANLTTQTHALVATLTKVRLAEFFNQNAHNTADSMMANAKSGLVRGPDGRLLLRNAYASSSIGMTKEDSVQLGPLMQQLTKADTAQQLESLFGQLCLAEYPESQETSLSSLYRTAMISAWCSTDTIQSSQTTPFRMTQERKQTVLESAESDGTVFMNRVLVTAMQIEQAEMNAELPQPLFDYIATHISREDASTFVPQHNHRFAKKVTTYLQSYVALALQHIGRNRIPTTDTAQSTHTNYGRFIQWISTLTSKSPYFFLRSSYRTWNNLHEINDTHNLLLRMFDASMIATGSDAQLNAVHKKLAQFALVYMQRHVIWKAFETTNNTGVFLILVDVLKTIGIQVVLDAYAFIRPLFYKSENNVGNQAAWIEYLVESIRSAPDGASSVTIHRAKNDLYSAVDSYYTAFLERSDDMRTSLSFVAVDSPTYKKYMSEFTEHFAKRFDDAILNMMINGFVFGFMGFALMERTNAPKTTNAPTPPFAHQTLRQAWLSALVQLSMGQPIVAGALTSDYTMRHEGPYFEFRSDANPDELARMRPDSTEEERIANKRLINICRSFRGSMFLDSAHKLLQFACILCAFSGEIDRTDETLLRRELFWKEHSPSLYAEERERTNVRNSNWREVGALRYMEYISWALVLVKSSWNLLSWSIRQREAGAFVDDRTLDLMPLVIETVRMAPPRFPFFRVLTTAVVHHRQWPSIFDYLANVVQHHLHTINYCVFGAAFAAWAGASPFERWISTNSVLQGLLIKYDHSSTYEEIPMDGELVSASFDLLATSENIHDSELLDIYQQNRELASIDDRAIFMDSEDDAPVPFVKSSANQLSTLALAFPSVPVHELHVYHGSGKWVQPMFAEPALPATLETTRMLLLEQKQNASRSMLDSTPERVQFAILQPNPREDISPSTTLRNRAVASVPSAGNLRNRFIASTQGTPLHRLHPFTHCINASANLQRASLTGGNLVDAFIALRFGFQEEKKIIQKTAEIIRGDALLVDDLVTYDHGYGVSSADIDFLRGQDDSDEEQEVSPRLHTVSNPFANINPDSIVELTNALEGAIESNFQRQRAVKSLQKRVQAQERSLYGSSNSPRRMRHRRSSLDSLS